MKIVGLNNLYRINNLNYKNKLSAPVSSPTNTSFTNADGIFKLYLGRDIVSFGSDYSKTMGYYQLPEGCYPDSFQIDAGKALCEGKDVLVEAPTGTGKTAIAHYAATKNLKEGKTTFYTTPLKALSNQKLNEFKSIYGENNVGILTGDRRENINAPVIIMTTEVYRNMALSNMYGEENPLIKNLGTVIFDEFHYLGDKDRGPVWEEAMMYTPKNVQTLALSATIGNPKDLQEWMNSLDGDNTCLISIPSECRHVPLQFDILETSAYEDEVKKLSKSKNKKKIQAPVVTNIDMNQKPVLSDYKNAVEKLKNREQLPAIFFVFSRYFSRDLVEYFAEEGADLTTKEEKEEISKILEKYESEKYIGSDLNVKALMKGYAIHNAGIMPNQKEMIEELFQKKLLKTVIATETLAAGINMPAKTVVISNTSKPTDNESTRFLTANEFKQMAGRAGRRGIDTIGYVYTMPVSIVSEQTFKNLEEQNSNDIKSNYNPDYGFLAGYVRHNDNTSKLKDIFDNSFYSYSKNIEEKNEKTNELIELSTKRYNVLKEFGYITEDNGKIKLTEKGQIVAEGRDREAIILSELISHKDLENITPEVLVMLSAAIANPTYGSEDDICTRANFMELFLNTEGNKEQIYNEILDSVLEKLVRIGIKIGNYTDDNNKINYNKLLCDVEKIQIPEKSSNELLDELKELDKKRKIIEIMQDKTTVYSDEVLVKLIKNGRNVPTKVLEDKLAHVEEYKRKIGTDNIERYLEKLQNDMLRFINPGKGNKGKAKAEKNLTEIKEEIKNANLMKFLDENLYGVINSNYKFIKKNDINEINRRYKLIDKQYLESTSRYELISKIQALMGMEEYDKEHDCNIEAYANMDFMDKLIIDLTRVTANLYTSELNNGLEETPKMYSKHAAGLVYKWAVLNKINGYSMENWYQVIGSDDTKTVDEGNIFRKIMQTADIVSQIGEMAEAGYKASENDVEKEYYSQLRQTAKKARELIIRTPVEI